MTTFVTVRVMHPQSREIYLNSDYTIAAGKSPGDTFTVPTGRTTFETVDSDDCVDFEGKVVLGVEDAGRERKLILSPVIPPRRIP